jgi:hypothetical protein
MPVYEFNTQGIKAERNTVIIFEESPMPNKTIINGIHAMPGTGLIRSKSGLAKRSAFLYQAIAIPRGVPIITARKYPDIAILSDDPICSGKVAPSGAVVVIFLMKVLKTTTGLGRVVLGNIFNTAVTRYQKHKNRITDTAEIQR